MTKFLISFFINDNDKNMRKQYGNLSSTTGITVNIVLSAVKIIIGIIANSISIIGDGINNLFDSAAAIILYISFKISSKPPDAKHPFGHARFEYISSSVIAVLVLYVGITLFKESINKIFHPNELNISILGIVLLIVSILVKVWLYFFYRTIGEIINSDLIKANSIDSIMDALGSSVIIISIVASMIFKINIDGYLGIFVAVIILKNGIDILRNTYDKLMGNPPSKEDTMNLKDKILAYPGVIGLHDMIIHDYGPGNKFVTCHIEVDAEIDAMKSHDLIDRIERDIEQDENIQITIHMDPVSINDPRTNRIKRNILRLMDEYNKKYTIHDFRIMDTDSGTNVIFDVLVPADESKNSDMILNELKMLIVSKYENYDPIITIDFDYM